MPTIWFDVTTIVHWRRPPVGVVRVEAECFKYLASLGGDDVRFCHFDRVGCRYHEISADYVRGVFNLHGHSVSPSPPEPVRAARRVTDFTKKAFEQFPPALRDQMFKVGRKSKPVLRSTLHQVRRARGLVSEMSRKVEELGEPRRIPDEPPLTPPADLQPGDVLVSIGLDWDQKNLPYLYQLKLALGLKVVLFCYDLIPVLLPHLCVGEVAGIFAQYFVNVAWCADEVLCISKSSQRDLLQLIRQTSAPEPHTRTITLGSNLPDSSAVERGDITKLVRGKFLLFVSTIERRKNHEVIYRAMTKLVEEGRTDLPQIVFVGMVGWGVQDFMSDLKLDPRVKGRFQLLNHVSDAQLALLYQHAEFTLYPSLYEGWGLPLAESLAQGKFCLASNTSSLPEVGGDLVEYLDPWESRRWAERIAFYLDHPEVLREREQAIRERYVPPTWEATGRSLHQAARELMTAAPKAPAAPQ